MAGKPTGSRVPVRGTIGKRIPLGGTTSSSGAQIGVNLELPDGTIPTLAQLAAILADPSYATDSGGVPATPITWQNITFVPPNVSRLAQSGVWYPPPPDDPEDGLIVPGPAGKAGANGTSGFPLYLEPEQPDDPVTIPGVAGAAGAAGAAGTAGAPGVSGFPIYVEPQDADDPLVVPGPVGATGPQGATGPSGAGSAAAAWAAYLDYDFDDQYWTNRDVSGSGDPNLWTGVNTFTGGGGGIPLLVVQGTSGQYAMKISGLASGTSDGLWIAAGATSSDIPFIIENQAANKVFMEVFGDGSFHLGYNSASAGTGTMQGAAGGGITITAPAATVALQVTAVTGSYAALFSGAGSSSNFGVEILAGTSSSDAALFVGKTSSAGNYYMVVWGDGGVTIGPSTVTTKSQGTLNVGTAYYLNNHLLQLASIASNTALNPVNFSDFDFDGDFGEPKYPALDLNYPYVFTPGKAGITISQQNAGGSALTINTGASGAGTYYSTLLVPAIVLNSSGSDYAKIQNDAANTWSIATGTSVTGLVTPVFQWTNAGSPSLTGRGPNAAALVDMTPDAGSYTGTLVGCTTSPTGTIVWSKQGNQVTMTVPSMTGTSNSTGLTITGSLPAEIQPSRNQNVIVPFLENAGALTHGTIQVANGSSTLTLFEGDSNTGASWTNSATTKGVASAFTFTYMLN